MKKLWVKLVVAAAVAVVAVLVVVPFFVNADTFRPAIERELSTALGRKVALGHIGLSLLTGSLVANDISIADDPAFSSAPFLHAKTLRIGVELGAFLFHHSVHITRFIVESPSIRLIHAANGRWNFSSLGGTPSQPTAPPTEPSGGVLPALTVSELKIENGSAELSSLPAAGNPFRCSDVNLTVRDLSISRSFPFALSLKVAGGGSLHLKGSAGPLALDDTSLTPFTATLSIQHFDPVAAGAIQPDDGISMLADFDAHLQSQSGKLATAGKATASQLKLARNGTPAPNPVEIGFNLADDLATRTGQVNDIAIATGGVAAHMAGSFRHDGAEPVLNLRLDAPHLPVDQVEQLLPAAGVVLPSGSQLRGGTIDAHLAVTGPVNALTIAGPIELDNSQLAGFDLGGQIQGIHPIDGTSGGTEIQKLYAEVNNSPQGTSFANIDAEVPRIGSATGDGTVSPSSDLNFQLKAKIAALSALGGDLSKGTGSLGSLFGRSSGSSSSGSASGASGGGIPLTITGTASHPSIHVQVGAMLKQAVGGLFGNSGSKKSLGSLKGLFGR